MTNISTKNPSIDPVDLQALSKVSENLIIYSSAAIQISNDITLKQRQAWIAMLDNAFSYLDTDEEYVIDLRELRRKIGFLDRSNKKFHEMLEGIPGKTVRWNVLGRDKTVKIRGVHSLLADLVIDGNTCVYTYGPMIRKMLRHPAVYAKISLSVATQFRSKYSLALWANVYSYYHDKKGVGETPWMTPNQVRVLLVGREKKYKSFDEYKFLNRDVIKPALQEVSDIVKLFKVKVEQKCKGRKVEAIKFKAHRDNRYYKKLQEQQVTTTPQIVTDLTNAQVSIGEVQNIWRKQWDFVDEDKKPNEGVYQDFEIYVREKIDLGIRKGLPPDRQGAFIRTAIKENYANPEFFSRITEYERDALRTEKENLIEQKGNEYQQVANEILQRDPSVLESTTAHFNNDIANQWLGKFTSVQNAYQDSPIIKARVHTILREKMFPELYAKIDQKYEKRLVEIDKKIEALK